MDHGCAAGACGIAVLCAGHRARGFGHRPERCVHLSGLSQHERGLSGRAAIRGNHAGIGCGDLGHYHGVGGLNPDGNHGKLETI